VSPELPRDNEGNMWARDRDGHGGSAWKKYDSKGETRLGSYDENLNYLRD
jgi:hypothetical protein